VIKATMEDELKKRKLEKTKEDEFAGKEEYTMSPAQMTTKITDQKEMITELFEEIHTMNQEYSELSQRVENTDKMVELMLKEFQREISTLRLEIDTLKGGKMNQERIPVPQKATETTKQPIEKGDQAWESATRRRKSIKETNKTASTVNKVLPIQTPQKQNAEKVTQATYLEKLKKNIKEAVDPSSLLLRKEQIHSDGDIVSMTIKVSLTDKAKNLSMLSILAVIEQKTGKKPLNISMISTTSAQILFRIEDTDSFHKLLDSDTIQLVATKKDDFHLKDITRLAHLYLSGYHKKLAYAALQDLQDPIKIQILTIAATLVKQRFYNVHTQKRWNFLIKRDLIAFQPSEEVIEV
jgi:hypothetical protein